MPAYTLPQYLEFHVYSHGFRVNIIRPETDVILNKFVSDNYVIAQFAKQSSGVIKKLNEQIFGIRSYDGSFYHFHIEQLQPLLKHLAYNYIDEARYSIQHYHLPEPTYFSFEPTKAKTPRKEQLDAIRFVVDSKQESDHSRLLMMPTGTGKTYTALMCACELGVRTGLFMLSGFIENWKRDIKGNLEGITDDNILVIQEGSKLRAAIKRAKADDLKDIKFVIISLETMAVFYKDYEKQNGNLEHTGYDITPVEFHSLLGIGFSVYDEVHKALNLVYKSISYSHTSLILGLSATMESLNRKVEEIQQMLFPNTIRFNDIKMKKYIEMLAIRYEFMNYNPKRIRTTLYGNNMYNDIAYEQSICNNPSLLRSYLEMQYYIMKHLFKGACDFYRPGDRAIVFASSVKMCTHLTNHLKAKYPELDVRRFAEGDPFENLMEPDIRVTTIKSGSTGHDIPNLTYCQMTTNVQSVVSNKQARGRLREIVGRNLRMCYTYCGQIDRHVEYHKARVRMFIDGVKTIKELDVPFKLR